MTTEFFPPTEQELEEMMFILQKKLESEKYRDQWQELHQQLEEIELQLSNLKNNKK